MTVALRTVERANLTACAEPVRYAMCANCLIAEVTQLLLSALNETVADAARLGSTDTGARRAAAALLDAHIAVHQAVTAAGRVLADRERTVDEPTAGVSTRPLPDRSRRGAAGSRRSQSPPAAPGRGHLERSVIRERARVRPRRLERAMAALSAQIRHR